MRKYISWAWKWSHYTAERRLWKRSDGRKAISVKRHHVLAGVRQRRTQEGRGTQPKYCLLSRVWVGPNIFEAQTVVAAPFSAPRVLLTRIYAALSVLGKFLGNFLAETGTTFYSVRGSSEEFGNAFGNPCPGAAIAYSMRVKVFAVFLYRSLRR